MICDGLIKNDSFFFSDPNLSRCDSHNCRPIGHRNELFKSKLKTKYCKSNISCKQNCIISWQFNNGKMLDFYIKCKRLRQNEKGKMSGILIIMLNSIKI